MCTEHTDCKKEKFVSVSKIVRDVIEGRKSGLPKSVNEGDEHDDRKSNPGKRPRKDIKVAVQRGYQEPIRK